MRKRHSANFSILVVLPQEPARVLPGPHFDPLATPSLFLSPFYSHPTWFTLNILEKLWVEELERGQASDIEGFNSPSEREEGSNGARMGCECRGHFNRLASHLSQL